MLARCLRIAHGKNTLPQNLGGMIYAKPRRVGMYKKYTNEVLQKLGGWKGGLARTALNIKLAEEEGFEPSTELPLCHLSRVVPSTAQPLIRI